MILRIQECRPSLRLPREIWRPWLLLAALLAELGVVVAIWTSIDRRPPEWDYANHLGRALECYRILAEPGHDRAREILEAAAFYPPVTTCAAGFLYFLFPVVPLTAQAVMLGFVALGAASVFLLGRRLLDTEAGLLAAFLLATAPFVVFSLTSFQLDVPLIGVVALSVYLLARTEAFSLTGWSVALGLGLGIGMLTKPPFVERSRESRREIAAEVSARILLQVSASRPAQIRSNRAVTSGSPLTSPGTPRSGPHLADLVTRRGSDADQPARSTGFGRLDRWRAAL